MAKAANGSEDVDAVAQLKREQAHYRTQIESAIALKTFAIGKNIEVPSTLVNDLHQLARLERDGKLDWAQLDQNIIALTALTFRMNLESIAHRADVAMRWNYGKAAP